MNMLKRLFVSKSELMIGIGFSLIGFFAGSTIIRNSYNNEIPFESPQEVKESESEASLDQSFLESEKPNNVAKTEDTDIKLLQDKNLPKAPSSSVNEFTSLSQEEKNCIIWKNAYPEAAYKLKQGDSCY
jgi:hypothetical protein